MFVAMRPRSRAGSSRSGDELTGERDPAACGSALLWAAMDAVFSPACLARARDNRANPVRGPAIRDANPGLDSQIRGPNGLITQEIRRRTAQRDTPILKNVAAISAFERDLHVLLDQQEG